MIPQGKDVSTFVTDKIHIVCQGEPLEKFLAARLGSISKGNQKQTLKIARCCARIRSHTPMRNPYGEHLYAARVEVGGRANWAENRERPYWGGREIFTELLHEGVVVRLCEGGLG